MTTKERTQRRPELTECTFLQWSDHSPRQSVGLVRFIESIFIRKEFRFLKAAHAWLDAENFNSWSDQSPRQSSVGLVRFIGSKKIRLLGRNAWLDAYVKNFTSFGKTPYGVGRALRYCNAETTGHRKHWQARCDPCHIKNEFNIFDLNEIGIRY